MEIRSFSDVILNPLSSSKTTGEKILSIVVSLALSILSIGIVPIGCLIYNRCITKQEDLTPTDTKVIAAANNKNLLKNSKQNSTKHSNNLDLSPEQNQAILNYIEQSGDANRFEELLMNSDLWDKETAKKIYANLKHLVDSPSSKTELPAIQTKKDYLGIKSTVSDVIDNIMNANKTNIRPNQKQAILESAAQAESDLEFETLIKRQTTQGVWGPEKEVHILKNLKHLFPDNEKFAAANFNANAVDPKLSKLNSFAIQIIPSLGTPLIGFYKTGITSFLGNFEPCNFNVENIQTGSIESYRCVEAYFQATKHQLIVNYHKNNPAIRNQILTIEKLLAEFKNADGERAFQINRELTNIYPPQTFYPDWIKGIRDQVMWKALIIKFSQPKFKELLEATGVAYLLEHNQATRDNYWSDNKDGTGKNKLGQMLMIIREKNRQNQNLEPNWIPVDLDQNFIRSAAQYANANPFDIF
jgi:predicted NAD-dependent protein-ADP-ribosyltransferase YbiA (DUF1768 family)